MVLTGLHSGVKDLLRLSFWLWTLGTLVMNRVIEHHEIDCVVDHVVWYLLRSASDDTINE
jgi:hypothetical protein